MSPWQRNDAQWRQCASLLRKGALQSERAARHVFANAQLVARTERARVWFASACALRARVTVERHAAMSRRGSGSRTCRRVAHALSASFAYASFARHSAFAPLYLLFRSA